MKQQQLTFEKGMTTTPSDSICSDNTLSISNGLTYYNGEHHIIQSPVPIIDTEDIGFDNPPTLIMVHRLPADVVNYIYQSMDNKIYFNQCDNNHLLYTGINGKATAQTIGNSLIIKDDSGILYFLWKESSYQTIGRKLPSPTVNFHMGTAKTSTTDNVNGHFAGEKGPYKAVNTQSADGVFDGNPIGVKREAQETYNNLVIGLYEKNKKAIHESKRFCEPFMACAAVELFDGSFILQTTPQLLFPAVRQNSCADLIINSENKASVSLYTYGLNLFFNASFDYTEYGELVKDVVVFITDGARLYDTSLDQRMTIKEQQTVFWDAIYYNDNNQNQYKELSTSEPSEGRTIFLPLRNYTNDEIIDNIKSNGIFYKAFSLGIKRDAGWTDATSLIKKHVIENLTTQEQLPIDYFSNCQLSATSMKALNNRLHIADVTRGYAPIGASYMPYERTKSGSVNPSATYYIYVRINTSNGLRTVTDTIETSEYLGNYFFYPDPRAKEVYITASPPTASTRFYLKLTLEEHPSLNGAFYLQRLPDGGNGDIPTYTTTALVTVNDTPENLQNQMYVSEASNPFVFRPEGVVAVGTGIIQSIASLTTALSQGQFGQYPLIVFTSQGIWALNVSGTGYYASAQPMSREVCNNVNSIVETDGNVFFASDKGLMVINGGQVVCVSEQLNGPSGGVSFKTFLKSCRIAYDYRDSLLWLMYAENEPYVFSIRSGTFANVTFQADNAISDYPDTLVQYENQIYSFTSRPIPENEHGLYSVSLKTRPLKLENGLALKRICEVSHIRDMDATYEDTTGLEPVTRNTLSFGIEASNNMKTWVHLSSLRGTPWKYYRFTYNFNGLKATDTFAGTVLVTEEVRIDKIR